MRLFFACLFAFLTAGVAIAAGTSATVSWNAPTTYIDGTVMPASDIASYTVSWAPAAGSTGGSVSVPATAISIVVPGLTCGSFTFSATVTTTATAVYPSQTSAASNAVPYATGVSCKPSPLVITVK